MLCSTRYPVNTEPPEDAGALHESESCVSPGVTTSESGDEGGPNGVDVDGVEVAPAPPDVTPATRKEYAVPFVRPMTVADAEVVPVFAIEVVHVAPLSADCSMR
jgi:hypothetical protein